MVWADTLVGADTMVHDKRHYHSMSSELPAVISGFYSIQLSTIISPNYRDKPLSRHSASKKPIVRPLLTARHLLASTV